MDTDNSSAISWLVLFTNLLYNQALLIEGLPINDPVEFTNNICNYSATDKKSMFFQQNAAILRIIAALR